VSRRAASARSGQLPDLRVVRDFFPSCLQAFWALDDLQRRALWGTTIKPTDALADLDPRYISDAQLDGP
jgi:hypothetical protein